MFIINAQKMPIPCPDPTVPHPYPDDVPCDPNWPPGEAPAIEMLEAPAIEMLEPPAIGV